MKKPKKRQIEVWDQKGNRSYEATAKVTFYALVFFLILIFATAIYGAFISNN
jgi:hypothetical protein